MIAAQMPLMMKLARETDGVFVTFAPPELTARARAVMGPERRVYVIQAFTLHTDPAKARAIGRQYTAFYSRLPNYRNCLMSMGFGEDDFANGGSDRLIDAIVAWGSEEALHDRLQAQFKAGADHVNVLALSDADAGSGQSQADEAVLRVLAPGWNRTSAP